MAVHLETATCISHVSWKVIILSNPDVTKIFHQYGYFVVGDAFDNQTIRKSFHLPQTTCYV